MVINALWRAQWGGQNFVWRVTTVIGLVGLLAACGGGGGSGPIGDTLAAAPITRTEAQVGDYFVYATTVTQTLPAGVQPNQNSSTESYLSIAANGTSQRVYTYSTGLASQYTIDVNEGLVGTVPLSGGTSCAYTPANQAPPPYPRSVGQTWSGTSVRTCGTTTATFTPAGKIVAREQLVTPAGTFDSYRAERTGLSVTATYTLSTQSTCWYSVQRGVMLKCDSSSTQTPAASTTPSYVVSSTTVLTGLGGPTRVAQGNVLARFAGAWRVQYTGGVSGNCAQLAVPANGSISGSCTAASGTSFSVTGSVIDSGAVTITLPTGGSLTGTLTTPYSGNGSWTDGSFTGTWTASHN